MITDKKYFSCSYVEDPHRGWTSHKFAFCCLCLLFITDASEMTFIPWSEKFSSSIWSFTLKLFILLNCQKCPPHEYTINHFFVKLLDYLRVSSDKSVQQPLTIQGTQVNNFTLCVKFWDHVDSYHDLEYLSMLLPTAKR